MTSFEESGLRPEILRAITEMGFTTPTPVQVETLPLINEPPTDLIALAQTGTGKTAGFGLPLLHQINPDDKRTQAIILCPTRELCLQITKDFEAFSKYLPNIFVTAVYGGAPIGVQSRQLNKGSQIVVGTPGRVVDMISRGILKLDTIQWFVLDEADEMLNMGFKDDLETVFKEMPEEKMTWLFSATMPVRVESITRKYMKDPKRVSIGKRNEGAANIQHDYYMVSARDRFEALSRIIDMHPEFYGVIFCRTRIETTDIAQKLARKGYPAQALNGDMSQAQRDQVMGAFRKGNLKLLVATDVAARGLDVDDLTHVINYNLPDDLEVYVHRSGRTGRAGKSGSSITIVHGREGGRIRDLEKITGKKFNLQKVPTGSEIGRLHVVKQTEALLDADVKVSNMGPLPAEVHLLFDGLSREQIIDQWIQYSFRQNVKEDANNADINVTSGKSAGRDRDDRSDRSDRRDRGGRNDRSERFERNDRRSDSRSGDTSPRRRGQDAGATREPFARDNERGGDRNERSRVDREPVRARDFDRPARRNDNEDFVEIEVNVGATQNMKPNRIMGLINEVTGDSSIKFGRIDIKDEKSFIGVETDYAKYVAKALDGFQFGSRKLKASFSTGGSDRRRSGGFEKDRSERPAYTRPGSEYNKSDSRDGGKFEKRRSNRKDGFDKKPRRRRL